MGGCTSCGMPIPDGQESSCSMCYGDVAYGTDGYYEEAMNSHYQQEYEEGQRTQHEEEQPQQEESRDE